jgi:aryl-alcohol dehydrogenase-like predicted oxidoreductase
MRTENLALGTVQMGISYGINNAKGKITAGESQRILELASKSGIKVLDTAVSYGDSHSVIGKFHETSETKFDIITKIPELTHEIDLENQLNSYLADLKCERIEGLLFHSFNAYFRHKSELDLFERLKVKGLFRHFGVSIYTNDEFETLLEDNRIDLIQLPFNLLDNFSQRGGLMEKAHKKGKIIYTRSAFLQGLFFKDPDDDNHIVRALRTQLKHIRGLAMEAGMSVNSLALNYCLGQKFIDKVIIGVDSIEQLSLNLSLTDNDLNPSIIEQIDNIHISNTDLLNPSLWWKK